MSTVSEILGGSSFPGVSRSTAEVPAVDPGVPLAPALAGEGAKGEREVSGGRR